MLRTGPITDRELVRWDVLVLVVLGGTLALVTRLVGWLWSVRLVALAPLVVTVLGLLAFIVLFRSQDPS